MFQMVEFVVLLCFSLEFGMCTENTILEQRICLSPLLLRLVRTDIHVNQQVALSRRGSDLQFHLFLLLTSLLSLRSRNASHDKVISKVFAQCSNEN